MKHIIPSFLIGILVNLFLLVSPAHGGCWFQFTCNQTDPGDIPYCTDGKCTITGGKTALEGSVGNLLVKKSISVFVTETVLYFLSFVSLIAVVYFIYAGFQLMISGGDEEKTKKTKRIMVYVLVGMIIIWLSYWIVALVLHAFS